MSGATITDFTTDYLYKNRTIQLIDLHEPDPNAPLIGSLLIDGHNIFRRVKFTGPVLFHGDHLFLPMARQMEDDLKFSVCSINLDTFEMAVNKEKFDFIHLEGIQKNWLVFKSDLLGLDQKYMDMMWVY